MIPLIPENAFFPYIGAETSQQYFPQLLLSDYESVRRGRARAHPGPLREGARRAGGGDDRDAGRLRRRPAPEPGWLRPGRARPATTPGTRPTPSPPRAHMSFYIEEQGPIAGVVQRHPPLRHGGHERRAGPQPAHLRDRHVEDHRLPGQPVARVDASGPTSSTGRPSTRWSRSTTTCRRRRSASCKTNRKPQGTCWVHGAALQAAAVDLRLLRDRSRSGEIRRRHSCYHEVRSCADLIGEGTQVGQAGGMQRVATAPFAGLTAPASPTEGSARSRAVQAAWYRTVTGWRRQRASYAVLVLLIGLVGGVRWGLWRRPAGRRRRSPPSWRGRTPRTS